jgi:hypothetical protein
VDYTGGTLIGANTGVSIATPTFTGVTREQTLGAIDQSASKSVILHNNGGTFRGAYSIVGKNRGIIGSFTALSASDTMGYYAFAGSTNTGMFVNAYISAISGSAWTDTSRETSVRILVTEPGATSPNIAYSFTGNMLKFAGSSAGYPALKVFGTSLQARLADDSGFATFDGRHRLQGAAPSSATSPGTAGEIRNDDNYLYIYTATRGWTFVPLTTLPA